MKKTNNQSPHNNIAFYKAAFLLNYARELSISMKINQLISPHLFSLQDFLQPFYV